MESQLKEEMLDKLSNINLFNNTSKKRTLHRRFQQNGWDIKIENGNIIFYDDNNQNGKNLLKNGKSFTLRGGSLKDEINIAINKINNDEIKIIKLDETQIKNEGFVEKERQLFKDVYYLVPYGSQRDVLAFYVKDDKLKLANSYVFAINFEDSKPYNWFYTFYETKSNDNYFISGYFTDIFPYINFRRNYQSDTDIEIKKINNNLIDNTMSEEVFYEYLRSLYLCPDTKLETIINGQQFHQKDKLDNVTKETIEMLFKKIIMNIFKDEQCTFSDEKQLILNHNKYHLDNKECCEKIFPTNHTWFISLYTKYEELQKINKYKIINTSSLGLIQFNLISYTKESI